MSDQRSIRHIRFRHAKERDANHFFDEWYQCDLGDLLKSYGVGLMSHIPDKVIERSFIDIM